MACDAALPTASLSRHLCQVSLGIRIHQQNFSSLPRKANSQAGSRGDLADAAFLIGKCNYFHKIPPKRKKEPFGSLFFRYEVFYGNK